MKKVVVILVIVSAFAFGQWDPKYDLDGDLRIGLGDFASLASHWLEEDVMGLTFTWVTVVDAGVSGHEGFSGNISKYETTNSQFCQFLNDALTDGLIAVYNGYVYAVSDVSYSQPYCRLYSYSPYWNAKISYSSWPSGHFYVTSGFEEHPAISVSWYGASAFCDYYGYRLPTQWEWQAIADYDGSYTYPCGLSIDSTKANYNSANPVSLAASPYTATIGYYTAYGYGLCDMTGNVWEWTSSLSDTSAVIKGGGWTNTPEYCTSVFALSTSAGGTYYDTGFRVCR